MIKTYPRVGRICLFVDDELSYKDLFCLRIDKKAEYEERFSVGFRWKYINKLKELGGTYSGFSILESKNWNQTIGNMKISVAKELVDSESFDHVTHIKDLFLDRQDIVRRWI